MSVEQFHEAALPWIRQAVKNPNVDTLEIAKGLQARNQRAQRNPGAVDFIDQLPEYSNELYTSKKMKTNPQTALPILEAVLPVLEKLEDFHEQSIHDALFQLIQQLG